MQTEMTKEQFDAMPEVLQKLCTEKDGKYTFMADTPDEVAGLKSALDKRTKAEKEAKTALEATKTELEKFNGIDPERHAELLAEAEKRESDSLNSKGHIDELIQGMSKKHETAIASQKAAYEAKIASINAELDRVIIDNRLRSVFESAGVISDRIDDAVELTKPRARRNEQGELILLDKDGAVLDVTPETYARDLLKEQKPWLYAGSGAGGSGAPPGTNGPNGKKTITRDTFNRMGPQEAA